jgi:hypothetical protein
MDSDRSSRGGKLDHGRRHHGLRGQIIENRLSFHSRPIRRLGHCYF